jgi:hypothetical protein
MINELRMKNMALCKLCLNLISQTQTRMDKSVHTHIHRAVPNEEYVNSYKIALQLSKGSFFV